MEASIAALFPDHCGSPKITRAKDPNHIDVHVVRNRRNQGCPESLQCWADSIHGGSKTSQSPAKVDYSKLDSGNLVTGAPVNTNRLKLLPQGARICHENILLMHSSHAIQAGQDVGNLCSPSRAKVGLSLPGNLRIDRHAIVLGPGRGWVQASFPYLLRRRRHPCPRARRQGWPPKGQGIAK